MLPVYELMDAATPEQLAAFDAAYERARERLKKRYPNNLAVAKAQAKAIVDHAMRVPESCGDWEWAICEKPQCERRCFVSAPTIQK